MVLQCRPFLLILDATDEEFKQPTKRADARADGPFGYQL